MIKMIVRRYEPLKSFKRLEEPIVKIYPKISYPISKILVGSSICIFALWYHIYRQFLPYKHMFRHFQVSEYTIQRGYLHTLFTGSLSHRDLGHIVPNMLVYTLLGRFIEQRYSSRHLFYLFVFSSVGGTLVLAFFEKVIGGDAVKMIVPKCNGSVPAAAMAGAVLAKNPFSYFNPLKLPHTMANELFMMPLFIPCIGYFMLEYYLYKQGFVEHICKV